MTLIIMLILSGISLSGLIGGKGLFQRTEDASNIYNEKKAREVLETVLLTYGQFEKNINPEYNQDDFLDALIRREIEGGDVKGDTAIAGEYAFALDRSVPKLGEYLGKKKDLVWPTITVSEPVLADNWKTSKFTVTAIEETNGISKIEVWLNGQRIEALTKTYDNVKTEIKETFTVNKNGKYTVKVYSKLSNNAATEVTGIVPAVEFLPNGSTNWKKEHSTKITVRETDETVTGMKYLWTDSETNEPKPEQFTQNCTNNSTITGKDMTGTYFLWILLEINTGKKNICGSNQFNFDNKKPNIITFTTDKHSETGITFNVTTQDENSGLAKVEFYVDDKLKVTEPYEAIKSSVTQSITIDGLTMGTHDCKIIVYDVLNNLNLATINASTLMHTWELHKVAYNITYDLVEKDNFDRYYEYTSGNAPDVDYTRDPPTLENRTG